MDADFPYAIGAAYNGQPVTGDGLCVEEIPAHTYAVFTCTGSMPQAFQELYHRIYSEFFPHQRVPALRKGRILGVPVGGRDVAGLLLQFWIAVEKKMN